MAMAIFHMSVKVISRSSGRSSVGSAAYRSGEELTNEYDGVTHDYTRKKGIEYSEIMLCENAPKEWQDREKLWNAVEKVEKSSKSQLAREVEVGLPSELDRKEQIELIRNYVKENFVDKGMCADINIHDKGTGNPHAHVMLTMRAVNEKGEWEAKQKKVYELDQEGNKIYDAKKKTYKCTTQKTTDWDNQENVSNWREDWAKQCNEFYKKKGIEKSIDHRSYKEQGIDKIPTIHLGSTANVMEKKGKLTDRGNLNREITLTNEQIEKVKADIERLETERKLVICRIEQPQERPVVKDQAPKENSSRVSLEQEHQVLQMKVYENKLGKLLHDETVIKRELEKADQSYQKLNAELKDVKASFEEVREYNTRIKEMKAEKEGLGLFKGAQKKELDRRMEELREYRTQEIENIANRTGQNIGNSKAVREYIESKEYDLVEIHDTRQEMKDKLTTMQPYKEQLKEKCQELDRDLREKQVNVEEVMNRIKTKQELKKGERPAEPQEKEIQRQVKQMIKHTNARAEERGRER